MALVASSAVVENVSSELSAEINKKQDVISNLIIQRAYFIKATGNYVYQIPIDVIPNYYVVNVFSASEGFVSPVYPNWYVTNRQPSKIECFVSNGQGFSGDNEYIRIIVTYMKKEFIGGQS